MEYRHLEMRRRYAVRPDQELGGAGGDDTAIDCRWRSWRAGTKTCRRRKLQYDRSPTAWVLQFSDIQCVLCAGSAGALTRAFGSQPSRSIAPIARGPPERLAHLVVDDAGIEAEVVEHPLMAKKREAGYRSLGYRMVDASELGLPPTQVSSSSKRSLSESALGRFRIIDPGARSP
jgi:hypothetical protein